MLRSMYSAISGMQAFETKLDVIGNNIANVNTTGFKAGRTDFNDVLSQTVSGGSAPSVTSGRGGTNPQQIGLGVKIAAIETLFTQGADQTTGNPTDLAINGAGLFVVSPNPAQGASATLLYARAGDFTIDSAGNLVLPNGMVAMGVPPSSSGSGPTPPPYTTLTAINVAPSSVSTSPNYNVSPNPDVQIGPDGGVSVTTNTGARKVIAYLSLATVSNPGGMQKVGDSLFQVSNNSGAATYTTPGVNNSGILQSGALEMSNVDLTREFTEMIVAQRGFDANSKMIGTDNAILQDIVNLKNA